VGDRCAAEGVRELESAGVGADPPCGRIEMAFGGREVVRRALARGQ